MTAFTDLWLRPVVLHLWQATLFGLAVSLAVVRLRGSARVRYFVGWLALLRFLIPAALLGPLTGVTPWTHSGGSWLASGLGGLWMPAFVVGVTGPESSTRVASPALPLVVAAVWVLGAIVGSGWAAFRLRRGLRVVRRTAVPFSVDQQRRLEALAGRVGLRAGRVTGWLVPADGWLGVVGLFRSRIIVPVGLFSALDEQEAESVLLHELVHVKRRDNLLRLCQAGVAALFWFHPLVWWLNRRLHWESERACDEGVLRLTGANRVYATGLFKAVRFALGLELPGVSGMSRTGLPARIRAVLHYQDRKDSPVKVALTTSLLIGLFGMTALFAPAGPAETPAAAPAPEPSVAAKEIATAAEAAESAAAAKIYDVSDLDQIPQVREQKSPLYPFDLRRAGVTGEVWLSFVVDREGKVGMVKVLKSTDRRFEPAAVEAVYQWEFNPGRRKGETVNVLMKVPIVFALNH